MYKHDRQESGFATPNEALAAAKKVVDERFEKEEERASFRRYLIEQDYEYFVKYLGQKNVQAEQIPLIASTLTLATIQKQALTSGLEVQVNGDIDANVSGNISTDS